ncbi:unnamed protein product, partial [Pleuronectes platessa]
CLLSMLWPLGHPLSVLRRDIQRPEQIRRELCDAISYQQGSFCSEMLSDFLTEEIFVMGSGTSWNTWVLQMGFPVRHHKHHQWGRSPRSTFSWIQTLKSQLRSPFKVNYDDSNWDKLLNRSAAPIIKAKIIPTVRALSTTKYLNQERDYMPWQSALGNLNFFYLMFDRSEVYGPCRYNQVNAISQAW